MNLLQKGQKLKILTLFLYLSANNLQASWLGETAQQGASALDTVNKVRHWEAWLAFGLMVALIGSIKHLPLIKNKKLAIAATVIVYASVSMSGGFFLSEYRPILAKIGKGIWYLFTGIFDLVGSLI